MTLPLKAGPLRSNARGSITIKVFQREQHHLSLLKE